MNFLYKLCLFFFLLTNSLQASESLSHYLKLMLENNLDIKLKNNEVEQSEATFLKAAGQFDTKVSLAQNYNQLNTPISSTLDTQGNTSSVITTTNSQTLSLSKTFSWTGTQASLPVAYKLVDSDSTYRTFRKTHEPSVGLTLKQPVIRSFVSGYFAKREIQSKNDFFAKKVENKEKVQELLKKGLEKIFSLLEKQKSLEILAISLKTSEDNYNFIKNKRKVGSASKIEEMDAYTAYNSSKQKLMEEEVRLRSLQREVASLVYGDSKTNINLNEIDLIGDTQDLELDITKLIENSKKIRGDYLSQKIKVEGQESQVRFANIDRLPKLDLDLSYTSMAIRAGSEDAIGDLSDVKFPTWKAGATLNYNLFQYAERGAQDLQQLKLRQEKLKLRQLIVGIQKEVETAVRNFNNQKVIIKSLKRSLDAENFKWEFYQKRFRQGKMTSMELSKIQKAKEQANLNYTKGVYKLEKYYYALPGVLTGILSI